MSSVIEKVNRLIDITSEMRGVFKGLEGIPGTKSEKKLLKVLSDLNSEINNSLKDIRNEILK